MDNQSKSATSLAGSHTTSSELEKFQLFYEFVPVQKNPGRVKRTSSSREK